MGMMMGTAPVPAEVAVVAEAVVAAEGEGEGEGGMTAAVRLRRPPRPWRRQWMRRAAVRAGAAVVWRAGRSGCGRRASLAAAVRAGASVTPACGVLRRHGLVRRGTRLKSCTRTSTCLCEPPGFDRLKRQRVLVLTRARCSYDHDKCTP